MVGFIAENVLAGLSKTITWRDVQSMKEEGAFFLDVRTAEEFALGAIDGAVNIPHTELRDRLSEVPRGKPIVINCAIGLRGYLAERVLRQNAFTEVVNLTGGYKTWKAATLEQQLLSGEGASAGLFDKNIAVSEEDGSPRRAMKEKTVSIDACGLQCPGPIMKLKQEMDKMSQGDQVKVSATDPGFARDVKSWCTLTGNDLVSLGTVNGIIEAVVEKGTGKPVVGAGQPVMYAGGNSATVIVFSNDLDRALASFVLANGAASIGKNVTMFFTFWGLSVLRKKKPIAVRKDLLGKMFALMLPKSMKSLSLSSLNFAGLGAKMMKFRMKQKNVDQLESMFTQARIAGVKMIACQMSMDIMGITAQELIEGVEIGGVATYMEAASSGNINLFV